MSRPAGVQPGDLMVVGLMYTSGTNVTIQTPPAGWTTIGRTDAGTTNGMVSFYKVAGASEPASYSFTLNQSPRWSIGISRITGANPDVPVFAFASSGLTSTSTTVVSPSVGATPAYSLVVSFHSTNSGATYTTASGTDERYDAPNTTAGSSPSNMMATFATTAGGDTPTLTATATASGARVAQQVVVLSGETDTYAAGSTTFTVPLGVTEITVEAWGAGGGGGRGTGGNSYGGGGGGGAYARGILAVTPGESFSISVGQGGGNAPSNNSDGGPGAASVFGSGVLQANGGGPGLARGVGAGAQATVSGQIGAAFTLGAVVSYSGGDGNIGGGGAAGTSQAGSPGVDLVGGKGGALFGGDGGPDAGLDGFSFGGGGSGNIGQGLSGQGGDGAIRITYARGDLLLSQPADAVVGTRAAYTVSRVTSTGAPILTGALTLELSALPVTTAAQFFAAATGGASITNVTIPNGSSSATFYFTSTLPNTYTVTVSSPVYAAVSDNIQFTPAPPAKFLVTQTNGQPIGPQLRNIPFDVRVTLADEFGNAVSNSGGTTTVTLTAAGGAIAGSLQSQSAPGSAVTASLTAGATSLTFSNVFYSGASGPSGFDVVITATGSGAGDGAGKTGQSNAFSVRNITLSVVAASASLTADGVSSTSVTVTLSEVQGDGSLTPLSNQPVRVSADFGILLRNGSPIFEQTAFNTDAGGQVLLTLQAGTVVGTATVTALCPGSCPATTSVTFVAGAPSVATSVLTASKTILSGDANQSNILSVLTLRLRDAFGNPTTTTSAVAFTSSLGSPISLVQSLGSGVYQATLTAAVPGTELVGATIGGTPIQATVEIRILPIEQYRSRQNGAWNNPDTWQRILPSGGWQNANTYPQPVLSENVTMAPLVAGVSAGSSPYATTSHTISLPAGLASGDRVLLFWTDANANSTVTTPAGWTVLSNTSGSNYRRIVYEKIATGSESRTFILSTSAAERSAHVTVAIAAGTYDGSTVIATPATGTSATPDAPALTSGFGSVGTLWLATAFSSGDDNVPTPAAPSGFTGLITGYAGEGVSGARMTVATRAEVALTLDPTAFTLGSSVTWAASTVAIRGLTVVASPSATSALIRENHTVTLTADQPMDQVIVASGGTMAFQGENAFTGLGPFVLQDGSTLRITSIDGISATATTGNIRFTGIQGAAARTFASDATYIYEAAFSQVTGDGLPAIVRNLTIANAAGTTLSTNLRINGRLSLTNGALTVPSGRSLDLDGYTGAVPAAESGRIILESGAIYRNLTVQRPRIEARRLIAGSKGWRMLSAPLATTYAQQFSGFVTQGFAGTGFPSLQTNLMWWDESDKGTTLQGWRKPASVTDSIVAGRGHFHYVFNGAQRPDAPVAYDDALPRTMSVTGFEHPFNADGGSRFSWPLTFSQRDTTSQSGTLYVDRVTADAGWNLIGNPTASTLDWGNGTAWTKTGLSNTIYVWDANLGDYRVWNGASGNLGNGHIAPFQAFWVKTTTTNPVLTMTSAAKSLQAGTFRGKEEGANDHDAAVLAFTLDADGRRAQTWLQFSESGRLGLDDHDAFRLSSPDNSWVTLHTRAPSADAAPMQINHMPSRFDGTQTLDLEIGAVRDLSPVAGEFTLSWTRPAAWPEDLHVLLMDHETRTTTVLSDSGSVTFEYETPRSFSAKTDTNDPLALPASPVLGSDNRAKLSETTYTRQTRFSLMVSNQALDQYLPRTVALDQNYPNPFNPSTTIRFHLPESQRVRIDLFDMLGRHIATLAEGDYAAGSHQIDWNAADLSSGVYLYRLSSGADVITRKLTLLK